MSIKKEFDKILATNRGNTGVLTFSYGGADWRLQLGELTIYGSSIEEAIIKMQKQLVIPSSSAPRIVILVQRYAYTPFETFGRMYISKDGEDYISTIHTVEKPWRNNKLNISCIPVGTYKARIGDFKGRYPNIELEDVPGRSAIEIHRGNTARDVVGCIAVGSGLGVAGGKWAVIDSAKAMDVMMAAIPDDAEITVVVSNAKEQGHGNA